MIHTNHSTGLVDTSLSGTHCYADHRRGAGNRRRRNVTFRRCGACYESPGAYTTVRCRPSESSEKPCGSRSHPREDATRHPASMIYSSVYSCADTLVLRAVPLTGLPARNSIRHRPLGVPHVNGHTGRGCPGRVHTYATSKTRAGEYAHVLRHVMASWQ